MIKKTFFIIIIVMFLTSCQSDSDYILKHNWKYRDGWTPNDWLSFDNKTYKLKNDTVYQLDSAIAIVLSLDKRVLSGDAILKVQCPKTGATGQYVEK